MLLTVFGYSSRSEQRSDERKQLTQGPLVAIKAMAVIVDVASAVTKNTNFLVVLYTSSNLQITQMNLMPREEIGEEMHDVVQALYVISGNGTAILDGRSMR